MYKVVFVEPLDNIEPPLLFSDKQEAEVYKAEHQYGKYATVISCGTANETST